ncbi:hypothetical protein Aco04nite_39140 [Winogradskya consettensis]|uniref:Uncharacterized protein n=2 Tax=Winogradskya consettensis TaxID=113560 RepID=A0A919SP10_9ACTN|nr:hypothetical protein Aco04nite_39140 [Actinoplanes consettensis]
MTGCGQGKPEAEKPRVATLVPPSASAAPSASATPERPRQRLDDTEADYQALVKPYQKCMKAQGFADEKSGASWAEGDDVPEELRKAQEKCKNFWPLPPWETDPANPEAKDFARDTVKCLKTKGVKYVEVNDDGIGISAGGKDNDSRSIALTGEYLDACQREVAAKK